MPTRNLSTSDKQLKFFYLKKRIDNLCLHAKVTKDDLYKISRKRIDKIYPILRQIFYSILHDQGYSYHEIAHVFKRSEPTIISAINRKKAHEHNFNRLAFYGDINCSSYKLFYDKLKSADYSYLTNELLQDDS